MSDSSMVGKAHHYGITVGDMERSIEFYRDELGMEELDRLGFESEAFSTFVDVDGATVDIVFLDAGGCAVELIEYADSGENITSTISNDMIGASHFCLEVDDIEARYEDLQGVTEFVSTPQTLENGAQVAYMYDPDGNIVELLEE